MSYSDYLVRPRTRGQTAWPAAARRPFRGQEISTYHIYSPRLAREVLPPSFNLRGTGLHGLEGQRWSDSGQNESWPDRILADLRPGFGDQAREVVELILVAVYASAALAEMAMALTPALH